MTAGALDPDRLKLFSFQLFSQLQGAVTAGMIYLGDRLGLYRALAEAERPLTTTELAGRTGLHERWVREWAYNQAAARLVDCDPGERLSLGAEAAAVLVDEHHPAFGMGMFQRLPQTIAALEVMPESFRTGLGHDYDSHGPGGALAIERSFEPWNRTYLVPEVLPKLDGVIEALARGIRVADIGCGTGSAPLLLGAAYPVSTVVGYDISAYALARARERLAASGLGNVSFADPRDAPLPADGSLGLVTTFDCIHDMTDPQGVIDAISAALAPDGTWLLVDIKAADSFAENAQRNPMAALMYGISVLTCMSSAMSAPHGAGLGTLGLPESKIRAMAAAAGLGHVRRLDIDHPTNAFYEIRR